MANFENFDSPRLELDKNGLDEPFLNISTSWLWNGEK